MTTLLNDLRYALRVLRQSPLATGVALVALALGIGANTAIFSVVHSVLIRSLPYRDAGRIATVLSRNSSPVAPAHLLDIRAQMRTLQNIEAAEAWGANLTGGDLPEQIRGMRLTPGMLDMLGVAPVRGRADLTAHRNLVLSYALWQRRFGGSDSAIGRTAILDGEPYTITGVMPPSFRFAPFWITDAEMWSQLDLSRRLDNRGGRSLRIFARLSPDTSIETAQAEASKLSADLARAYPQSDARLDLRVEPLHEKVVGKVREALLVLLGAVGLVLLIACANVANVSLARAAARSREIAIRLSLGAARGRIMRQLLTESVVLSLAGGSLGLLLAAWGTTALRTTAQPASLPRWQEISISAPVLLFTLVITIGTGLLFGLAPALLASRPDLQGVLKQSGRGIAAGRRGRRLLVAAEVALAFVLLAGAGLLVRSFIHLRAIDPGFNPNNVLTMTVSVAGQPQYSGEARENLYRAILSRIRSLPGVNAASMTNHLPLAGDVWGMRVAIEGRPIPNPGDEIRAVFRVALTGYFETMRVPIVRGRDFTERDRAGSPGVVIVNETFARRHFGSEDPIGRRVTLDNPRGTPAWLTIAGVVKDIRQGAWAAETENEIFLPLLQDGAGLLSGPGPASSYITVVVRTAGDPVALASGVRAAVWSVDRNLPVSRVQTMTEVIDTATSQPRFQVMLAGLFAAVALALAVIGIYGVIAYEVAQRTSEIGIRMALGSARAGIVRLVLAQSMAVAGAGLLAGIVLALALARLMRNLLYGVSSFDPLTFMVVAAAVLLTAALAAAIPALRAARTDPIVALRYE